MIKEKGYEKETDNEMLYMIEEENEDAVLSLIDKYDSIINKIVKKYYNRNVNLGIDEKDLYQEGLLGLLEAINRYDKNKEVLFKTYASKCIETNIITFIRKCARKKHSVLNDSVSLDKEIDEDNDVYTLIKDEEFNPEERILFNSIIEETKGKLKETLTDFEYKVFILNVKDYKAKEIADITNKDIKSVFNALQRIRKKLSILKKDLS